MTGPFAVRGAEAEQVLQVTQHAVQPQPSTGTAWTGIIRGLGALSRDGYSLQQPLEPVTTLVAYDERKARLPAREGNVPIRLEWTSRSGVGEGTAGGSRAGEGHADAPKQH